MACAAAGATLLLPVAASGATPKRKPTVRAAKPAVPAAPRITFNIVADGRGASPGPDAVVRLAYIGRLADGTVFDYNGDAIMPVAEVVTGFGQALQRMKRGGSYHVTIPPSLGYGARATEAIPANSTLVFDILFFDFRTAAEMEAAQKAMEAAKPQPAPPTASAP